MRSFYAAHYREPLFPFIIKIFLALLNDQDVAVSFASGAFSVLSVVATYLLGVYAFSTWGGIGCSTGDGDRTRRDFMGGRGWTSLLERPETGPQGAYCVSPVSPRPFDQMVGPAGVCGSSSVSNSIDRTR